MKTYGNGMKTTEFTKKQINVIYSMAKQDKLKVEKWYINNLYSLADYYNYDSNGSTELEERFVLNILRNVLRVTLKKHRQESKEKQIECLIYTAQKLAKLLIEAY